MRIIQHWIAGSETTGASTRFAPVYDPATGATQAQVALAEPADVDAAVAAAGKAFEEWRDVSLIRRARIMFALRDLIERHLDELSVLIADEHGKVVSDAKGEVIRGLEVVEYASGIPSLLKGEYSEQVSTRTARVDRRAGRIFIPHERKRRGAGNPGAWPRAPGPRHLP